MITVKEHDKWLEISTTALLTLMSTQNKAHKHEFLIGDVRYNVGDEVTEDVYNAFKQEQVWEILND